MKAASLAGILAVCVLLGTAASASAGFLGGLDLGHAGDPGTVAGSATGPDFETVNVIYTGKYVFTNLDQTGAELLGAEEDVRRWRHRGQQTPLKDIIALAGAAPRRCTRLRSPLPS